MAFLDNKTFAGNDSGLANIMTDDNRNFYINVTKMPDVQFPLIFFGLDGKAKLIIKKDGSQSVTINDTYGKTTLYDIDVPIKYISGFGSSNSYKSNSYGSNSYDSNSYGSKSYGSPRSSYYNYQSNDQSNDYSNDQSNFNNNNNNNNVTQNQSTAGSTYDSVFPTGIPKSMIPAGQENLYILKSQIVPPVCPSQCANSSSSASNTKCPPCPGCERCKEPDFACKKVPNYGGDGNDEKSFSGWDRDKGSRSNYDSSSGNWGNGGGGGDGSSYGSPNGNWGNGGVNGASYGSSNDMNANARSSVNNEYSPVPVLSDFSNFGM